jgi:hypothetical protein
MRFIGKKGDYARLLGIKSQQPYMAAMILSTNFIDSMVCYYIFIDFSG